jgi:hypothetical protein
LPATQARPFASAVRPVAGRAREVVRRRPGRLTGTVGDAFFVPLPESELDAWEPR